MYGCCVGGACVCGIGIGSSLNCSSGLPCSKKPEACFYEDVYGAMDCSFGWFCFWTSSKIWLILSRIISSPTRRFIDKSSDAELMFTSSSPRISYITISATASINYDSVSDYLDVMDSVDWCSVFWVCAYAALAILVFTMIMSSSSYCCALTPFIVTVPWFYAWSLEKGST